MSRKDQIIKEMEAHQQRLQLLKEKRAQLGISADPGIEIEIKDINTIINNLLGELHKIEKGNFSRISTDISSTREKLYEVVLNWAERGKPSLARRDLSKMDLRLTNLAGADLRMIRFVETDLTQADLHGTDLRLASLTNTNLEKANLTTSNLEEADLVGANLAKANLTNANLTGAKISGANLKEANLTNANLSGADLSDSNLELINLSDANLYKADLRRANLSRANLRGANLHRANITGTNMEKADLFKTNLSETYRERVKTREIIDPKDAFVLVVEDNLQNLVLIARLLAFIGVRRYEWKASGWGVLEFAETMPRVDLVVMDLHLPVEDGYDALARIRSDPRLSETLVIAVTADANPASLEKTMRAGFDGFIGKPVDPIKFPEQIISILQGKSVWDLGY
ncbi:MAG: response regulator [Colwellia sp.]|nr:response regulator [Colwellia sp.]